MEEKKNKNYPVDIEKKLEKAFQKEEKSWAGFFIKHFRFTYLIIIAVLFLGMFSLFTLPREAEPEVEVPFAVVNTVFPGASPSDVEDLVTNEIEEEIDKLDNIKEYNSTSKQGFSNIFVEFEAEADLKESMRKLREAVDNAQPNLPDDVNSPNVTELSFSDTPIVTYSLIGDYSDENLEKYAETFEEELEKIPGVSRIDIIGGVEREFQVLLDRVKLNNYNISLNQVNEAIQKSNFNLPAGEVEIEGFNYNIRVSSHLEEAKHLEDVVVATYESSPVLLKDIATVKDTFKDKKTESRIGFNGDSARNAISLQSYKKTGGNIIKIVDTSREKINNLSNNQIFPPNLRIEKTNDNSVFIREDINTLGTSALQTFILIAIILLLILSFRGALITALSVPVAFLIAFIAIKAQGMTLNSMVLFSLVLSLGLMVDNAIVIIEGINEYVSEYGKSIYKAAILSVWNFKWPIIAGTLTTVSAFLPMLLVSGILGEYLSFIPKTVTATLLSSLFVALVVIPTLAARFIKIKNNGTGKYRSKKRHLFVAGQMQKIYKKYRYFLHRVLPYKGRRRVLLGAFWILFFMAVAIPVTGLMKIEMFPEIDFDYFVVNVELPAGSTLNQTGEVVTKVEEKISQIPELDNYVTNIGSSMSLMPGGSGGSGTHKANITVNLKDEKERERTSFEISEKLREEFKSVQEAEVKVEELRAGPPSGAPIEVRIFGNDLKKLSNLSGQIFNYFDQKQETINVQESIEESTGEFVVKVNREKADFYGLSQASIASILRSAVFGNEATTLNLPGDDISVVVKYDKKNFQSISDIKNLIINSPKGPVALGEVADITIQPSLLNINHRNGERIVTVSSDIRPGVDLQQVLSAFDKKKQELAIPEGFSIQVGGELEDITRSYQETFYSMIVAIILISGILILQFNSFRQPLIIIFTLPLAIIGVIFGLTLFNQAFSFPAFIGIVALAGIVVNDAIVLIDRINKNIDNGLEFEEAIINGGVSRMQPILLTSITTIAGIFPLIYANEVWRGLSLSVIFGLMFSTVLTLVVMPVFYAGLCRKEKCARKD